MVRPIGFTHYVIKLLKALGHGFKQMNTLKDKTEGVYIVTTEYGTYYIIDLDNRKGKRVPAENRNELRADNNWFHIHSIDVCEVGHEMFLKCRGIASDDFYTWRRSTIVTSIYALEGRH